MPRRYYAAFSWRQDAAGRYAAALHASLLAALIMPLRYFSFRHAIDDVYYAAGVSFDITCHCYMLSMLLMTYAAFFQR